MVKEVLRLREEKAVLAFALQPPMHESLAYNA